MADAGVGETVAAEGAKTGAEAAAGDAAIGSGVADAAAGSAAAGAGGTAVAGGATAAGAGSGVAGTVGASLAVGAGEAVVSSLLAPRPPGSPAPTLMPDPLAQQEEERRKIAEQMARRGRASTVLTSPSGGSLGG